VQKLLKRSRAGGPFFLGAAHSRSRCVRCIEMSHRRSHVELSTGSSPLVGRLPLALRFIARRGLDRRWIQIDDDMKPQLQKQKLNRNSAFRCT